MKRFIFPLTHQFFLKTPRSPLAALASLTVIVVGCGSSGSTAPSTGGTIPSTPKISIQPMTSVNVTAGTGYFQDPYPIHTITTNGASSSPTFAGTTKQLLSCPGQLQPSCFLSSPVALDASASIMQQLASAGSSLNNFENLNIYQDSSGAWQMAVTAHLAQQGVADWNVILHASPKGSVSSVPTSWVADAVLIGSLSTPAPENYDGKYFEDNGTLYLIYSMTLVRGSQDGVVAQAMVSPTQLATSSPVPLLGPETSNGGYNSELFLGLNQTTSSLKLIETGNVTKIQGKYVMTYSDGGYNQPDYKSGVAWSDTFLPPTGTYYQRVQKTDTAGVWGQPNHAEVQYLLQSQISQWPNYVADQVLAPGVPAIVSDASGNFFLTFSGYDPSDAPTDSSANYLGAHRRPYYIKLQIQIPTGSTVAGTSPQDLSSWIQPATAP